MRDKVEHLQQTSKIHWRRTGRWCVWAEKLRLK